MRLFYKVDLSASAQDDKRWNTQYIMLNYALKRFLAMIPTLLGISLITFFMIKLAPGDPVTLKLNMGTLKSEHMSKDLIKGMRKQYGLDQAIPTLYAKKLHALIMWVHGEDSHENPSTLRKSGVWFAQNSIQYRKWLFRMLQLDFGRSLKPDKKLVLDKIKEALPITLTLNLLDIMIVYTISLFLGIYAALKKDQWIDKIMMVKMFILYSLPSFWVATLLLMFFSSGAYFDFFPLGGWISKGIEDWPWWQKLGNIAWHLALPLLAMVYGSFAYLSRFVRSSFLDVLHQDYIRTARAKGLKEKTVILKHALRNSMIPLITLLGTLLPALLGGSVIIEQIFGIPGMGKLGFESIEARDYTTIMAIATISAFLTLISLFISDLAYTWADPRINFKNIENR